MEYNRVKNYLKTRAAGIFIPFLKIIEKHQKVFRINLSLYASFLTGLILLSGSWNTDLYSYNSCDGYWGCFDKYNKAKSYDEKAYYIQEVIKQWKPADTEANLKVARDHQIYIHTSYAVENYKLYVFKNINDSYEKAVNAYRKVIELKPDDYEAYYFIEYLYSRKNDIDSGLKFFNLLLEKNNSNASALLTRGNLYFKKEEYFKAEQDFLKLLSIYPDNFSAYKNLGIIFLKTSRENESIAAFDQAVKLKELQISSAKEKNQLNLASINELISLYGEIAHHYKKQDLYDKIIELGKKGFSQNQDADNWYLADAYSWAHSVYGTVELGNGNYSKAASHYQQAVQIIKKNSLLSKDQNNIETLQFYQELSLRREKMGEIKPELTHKILGVFIRDTDVDFLDGKKKRIKAKTGPITERMKKYIIIQEKAFVRYIEAVSRGKMTVVFSNEDFDSTVKDIHIGFYQDKGGSPIELRLPVLDSLSNPIGDFMNQRYSMYDSFIIFWNATGFGTVFVGSGAAFPIIPYQLYGEIRGGMTLMAEYMEGSPGMGILIHEFHHVIEYLTGITPAHGYLDVYRNLTPGWKGKGEMSYFQYHFDNTIPKKGIENLNFLKRFPRKITSEIIDLNREKIKAIPVSQLKEAYELATQASALFHQNKKKEAYEKYEQAYRKNPYHPDTLAKLGEKAAAEKKYIDALAFFNQYIELNPRQPNYYGARASVNFALGKKREAALDYKKSAQLDARQGEWLYQNIYFYYWFWYYENKEQFPMQQEISDFSSIIENNRDAAGAYTIRAWLYRQNNNKEQALQDYSTALKINPEYSDAYYNRGDLFLEMQEKNKAKADFIEAAKFGNKDAEKALRKMK